LGTSASAITRKIMPTSTATATPRKTNHRPGKTPACFDDSAEPAIAAMIGEAAKNAMSAAITVRSGDNVIPISRRTPTAKTSTVSTVKNANSGMRRTVTANHPGSTEGWTGGRDHHTVDLFRHIGRGPLQAARVAAGQDYADALGASPAGRLGHNAGAT